MKNIVFHDLADYLRHGREIEFSYKGIQYSITNHSGYWFLCSDTNHTPLEMVCRFEEREVLISRISLFIVEDLTIQQIFDRQVYDPERLCIL